MFILDEYKGKSSLLLNRFLASLKNKVWEFGLKELVLDKGRNTEVWLRKNSSINYHERKFFIKHA
jgi:hypothetical protein